MSTSMEDNLELFRMIADFCHKCVISTVPEKLQLTSQAVFPEEHPLVQAFVHMEEQAEL